MKINVILFVLILVCGFSLADEQTESIDYAPYPQPDRGYVTDHANLLSFEQEERIEAWLYTTEKEKGVEIAVVTIDSIKDYPGTDNRNIENFAAGLFNKYGIDNMPENNGVLLLVAVKDREARIELGKYYGRSRDGDANRIVQRKILPKFSKDKYDTGIINGTRAIVSEFGRMRIIPGWVIYAVIGAISALIPITISLFKNGKRGWGWICVGLIIVFLLILINLLRHIVTVLPASGRSDGGVGGFGGGFGGGSSGGGGATGSW